MKEALKLALEALTAWDEWSDHTPPKTTEAITAIKAALAQPAQEPVAWLSEIAKELGDTSLASFGQVATGIRDLKERLTTPPQPEERNFCPRCGKRTADLTVIHTCTPPQERTWVGLDEKDFSAINQSCLTKLQAATSAESVLKEKNT